MNHIVEKKLKKEKILLVEIHREKKEIFKKKNLQEC